MGVIMRTKIIAVLVLACIVGLATSACKARKGNVGSTTNPVRFYFMPLKEEAVFKANAPVIKNYLEQKTGLAVTTVPAPDFLTIIKAFNNQQADVAFMNTLGYLMAHDWAKTEAPLKTLYGDIYTSYRGEFITRVDRGIGKLEDLTGKTIAFADPFSASGYLYALKLLNDKGIKPAKTIFAGGHKKAVEMVYKGEVDAAATYHSQPSGSGVGGDARTELIRQYPDVIAQVKIITLTDEIPNGPVALRHDLSPEIKSKLIDALLEFANTAEGRTVLSNLYNMTGLTKAGENDYNQVRDVIKKLGKSVEEVVPGGLTFYEQTIMPMMRD
jgi:phosphonate transport system substrate-binding protein